MIQTGSKVRYKAETSWAYEHDKVYEVTGYDEELDAWGVISETGEAYLVGEDDLEEIPRRILLGAVLGDMIGSPYEFDQGNKSKEFEMFNPGIRYTDDTVMTLAIAKAIMNVGPDVDEAAMKDKFIACMQDFGNRYAQGEYGGRFAGWLRSDDPRPYNSWGNGSAMRVSSIGWLYDTLARTREVARWTAEVTHNHPEGIKGAESVASVIFMARKGYDKSVIRKYVEDSFGYDLSRTCDEIRPSYRHVESCQETVPEAITAFLEGDDFEDVIRTAVSLGGDCDTLTCIAGAMAEAYYGIPEEFIPECESRLPEELLGILVDFSELKDHDVEYCKKYELMTFKDIQGFFL